MSVLGHLVKITVKWNEEEGFKAAYVFFCCENWVCVSRSKGKDEFKGKTFHRSHCQGRILPLFYVYLCV